MSGRRTHPIGQDFKFVHQDVVIYGTIIDRDQSDYVYRLLSCTSSVFCMEYSSLPGAYWFSTLSLFDSGLVYVDNSIFRELVEAYERA